MAISPFISPEKGNSDLYREIISPQSQLLKTKTGKKKKPNVRP